MIIKAPSLSDTYSHVYSRDTALDYDHDDFGEAYKRFVDTGEMSHLEPFIKDGQECAVWELKPIQGRARRLLGALGQEHSDADGMITDGQVFFVACALGVRGVSGAFDERNKPLTLGIDRDRETKLKCLTDETMNLLDSIDRGSLVTELGIRVIRQMTLDPD